MKKHPLLAAGAAAGTAVLGAAYAVYRVAFYQKPTTKVPSPADMPTRECYRKAMGPDADALARDMFKAVHITAQDGTPLAARYYHHADGAPLAIIFHGYRGYAERDGLGGYTLCTALGYNVLLPDQRAHGYSGGHTITMGVKERYDARDWTVWARSRFGPEVPIFLMGVSMGAATVLLAAGLNLPDNVCGIVADGWARSCSATLTPRTPTARPPQRRARCRFCLSTATRTALYPMIWGSATMKPAARKARNF